MDQNNQHENTSTDFAQSMKRLIVVLGMHRSGTSVITRGLQTMGVNLGDRLMPPKGDNSKGFWEDLDINEFNIELLKSLGSDWYHLKPLSWQDIDVLRKKGLMLAAVELLQKKTDGVPIFGFKDPRVAKLMLFWETVFKHCELDTSYVLAVRHPLSVVKSLYKRNGFDAQRSYLLWLEHVIASLSAGTNAKRVVIDYDRLISSKGEELCRVAKKLDLVVDPAELLNYKSTFLEEELRHTRYDAKDLLLDDACPALVRDVYNLLLDIASDKLSINDQSIQHHITSCIEKYQHLKVPLVFIDKVAAQEAAVVHLVSERDSEINRLKQSAVDKDIQIGGLTQAVAERDGEIARLNQAVTERDGQIASLSQAVAERDSQIASLGQAVTERDEQIASLSQAVTERDAQIASLSQAVAERDGQIASLGQAVTERDGQVASLSQAVTERDAQIASLSQAVTERDGQIASLTDETVRRGVWALGLDADLKEERAKVSALTMSHSWRITRPLREARRWISSPNVQAKRYIKAALRFAKRTYQSLPLSSQTKAKHRQWIAKVAPRVLLASGAHPSTIPVLSIPQPSTGKATIQVYPQAIKNENIKAAGISITTSDNPLVSVIVPIYGKVDYTLRCLASVAAYTPLAEFEVVVVDDCSPDNSLDALSQKVEGIRVLRNERNQGFIRSCNIGAKAAKGQYLYFLNNDTEVTEGWLDALLRTFSDFPGTGLAGSKLVYPDGRLQEAGGIIWQDGSAWNFGRFQDPQLPVYNYAREVDYCSGASIMVPKSLFEELGGFDEHYLPAYCEDSDLALKIRDKGYRVIYQPLSTVIHHEGITSGIDTTQGVKAYQVENSKKLFERWQQRLQFHEAPGNDVDNAKDRRATRRVLVLDHCTPTPNQDAGSVTAFNLLLLLREMDFQVTFIPEDNFLYMPEYTTALQRNGIEVLYAPFFTSVEQHLQEQGARYDLAFLFRPGVVERHLPSIRKYCSKAKVLFETCDLHFLRMTREAELKNDKDKKKAAKEMQELELAALEAVDSSIVRSEVELELLESMTVNSKLHLFPLIMNVQGTANGFAERKDIVFVGGYQHTPNVDAVTYFTKEVMPLLRKKIPGVRFYAVGSKPPAEIKVLESEDVIITGFVEDLNPLLDKMRVSVAPLRYGAGIKGKIGTAMAAGLPVVATSLAAEGMSLTDGENILVADGSEAFANAVARIYQDEALWSSISQNGLEFADRTWGAEAAWATLAGILSELGFTPARKQKKLALYASSSQEASEKKQDLEKLGMKPNEDYRKKIQQELVIYEKQVNVHDLPDIFHYWSGKFLAPIFRDAGFSTIAEFFSTNLLAAAHRTRASTANFVSVGAGNCDLEVAIAKNLLNAGFDNFTLECLEINPVMLERGKEIAKQSGVFNNMFFVEADFNTWVPDKYYHGVMANQSLHHVVRLEHLFDQIKNALHEDGSFVISDIIGRNGHQRWPEALEIVNRFWKELPESKKFNVLLNRIEKEYDNWDCSKEGFEGIRAQDILHLLVQRFQCEKFVSFGNVIDIFVDRCFGHNFNRDSQEDRDLIDRVHAEDEAGFASGFLKPTHMMAVFVKILHCAPYYSRGIAPVAAIRNPDL